MMSISPRLPLFSMPTPLQPKGRLEATRLAVLRVPEELITTLPPTWLKVNVTLA
ncbi:hypothetical protein D3C83_149250 [compost metagenome]